jgi:hypothetical protein
MIAHVILFQPRPEITSQEREAVLAALAEAARAPTVRSCRVGRRVTHGLPGYEQLMPRFEFAAVIEFDDVDGLRAYLQHPAHETAGKYFTTAAATALALDYEMTDLGNLAASFASDR